MLVAATVVASALSASPGTAEASHTGLFKTPLPIPPVYTGKNIKITMRKACIQVLPGQCTEMWTYDGMFPGPTLRRPSGKTTKVTFVNKLPEEAGSMSVHHHGSHSAPEYDGQPDDFLIPPGDKRTYVYEFMERGEPERAATQWYHDHRMDVTGRNVWMGLAGIFILDDAFDRKLPLPKGEYDVPLMIVDRSFSGDNQLEYRFNFVGTFGDHVVVNGAVSPYFEVADRKYRFRILNASNVREYRFALDSGQEMIQIASESGLLPEPVRRSSLVLGPAERAEVIVDFGGHLGEDIVLLNTIPVSGAGEPEIREVMQFRVRHDTADDSKVPTKLRPVPEFGNPSITRVWTLSNIPVAGSLRHPEGQGPGFRDLWTINGLPFDPTRVDAEPVLGATERWVFANTSYQLHRIHIHDVDWRVVSRTGGREVGSPGDPDAAMGEAGLRETFLVQSGEVVEVISQFTDHLGRYVFHCHILEHEDNAMMAQFEVVPTFPAPSSSRPRSR